jgi:hypothetical protein
MMKLDRKDLGAGATFVAIGLLYGGIAIFGGFKNPSLPMGQALSMGPGYFPVVLSGLLILVGGILIGRSFFASQETDFFDVISWRAIFMLSLAVILFGALLREMGMLLALFVATFLSALSSKHISFLYAAAVAAGVAIFCVLVFGPYGVRLPIPVIGTWFVN